MLTQRSQEYIKIEPNIDIDKTFQTDRENKIDHFYISKLSQVRSYSKTSLICIRVKIQELMQNLPKQQIIYCLCEIIKYSNSINQNTTKRS